MTATEENIRVAEIPLHVRDGDTSSGMNIEGYALEFNQPSNPIPFIEFIDPKALNGVDLSKVQLLYGHDFNNVLARVDAATLQLNVDDKGLAFTAQLPDTTLGHDTFTNIQNGNLKGMSFRFDVADDVWSIDTEGNTVHTILSFASIDEISITSLPAYDETSVSVKRSMEAFLNAKKQEERSLAKEKSQSSEPKLSPEAINKIAAIIAADSSAGNSAASSAARSATSASGSQKSNDGSVAGSSATQSTARSATSAASQSTSSSATQSATSNAARDDTEVDSSDATDNRSAASSSQNAANSAAPKDKGGARSMAQNLTEKNKDDKQTRGFVEYLRSHGQTRDSIVTVDNEVVIPHAILDVQAQPNDPTQLSTMVHKIQVGAPKGSLPVLMKNTGRLLSKAELEKNPELAKFQLKDVEYAIQTLAGVLPVSYEILSDAQADIAGIVSNYVQQTRSLTEQYAIGGVLAKASAVSAKTVDDLKDAYNHGLSNYNRQIVASETAYADLDKVKDNNGRYLLQDSITSASGKSLFGASVTVVPDEVLGKTGESHLFMGDLKAFVLEPFKDQVTVQWIDNDLWGKKVAVYLRADFQVADEAAGKFITLSLPASATAVPTK